MMLNEDEEMPHPIQLPRRLELIVIAICWAIVLACVILVHGETIMLRLFYIIRRWLHLPPRQEPPTPTSGVGLGRGTNREPRSYDKYWGSTGVAIALLLASAPALAGNYEASSFGHLGGAFGGANAPSYSRPGGLGFANPNAGIGGWYRANQPLNRTVDMTAARHLRDTIGGWFSDFMDMMTAYPGSTGWSDYDAGNYGEMDPGSRGSGVRAW